MNARRAMPAVLLLGAAGLGAALVRPTGDALADCNRGCDASKRDAQGCCPAPAPGPAKPGACPFGQDRGPDTAGHCCWPKQVWSNEQSKCIGTPQCPSDRETSGTDCVCTQGKVVTPDTKGHCCWQGQAWSVNDSKCVGTPKSCPRGYAAVQDECMAPWACIDQVCGGSSTTNCYARDVCEAARSQATPPSCTKGACTDRGPTAYCMQWKPKDIETVCYATEPSCKENERAAGGMTTRACAPRAPFDTRNGAW